MSNYLRKFAFAIVAAVLLSCTPLHAQEPQQKSEPAAQQSAEQKPNQPTNPNTAVSKELVEASKAAEGEPEKEDQATGLKHSVAVRWIARKAGISVETAYWIAMGLNFAIVFFAIVALMRSQLPGYFRSRNEAIQRGIVEARAASEDAKRRLTDIEARLSKLDSEVAEVRAEAEKESAAEEARIRAAAEADVKRILESAEQEIDAAARQATRDLKSLAAGLAVDLAARKLHVDQATDESLVRNFVSQLGKDGR
jgi:F-type H+-transporting ATPase subunit b